MKPRFKQIMHTSHRITGTSKKMDSWTTLIRGDLKPSPKIKRSLDHRYT